MRALDLAENAPRASSALPPRCHRARRALAWRRFDRRRVARPGALARARSSGGSSPRTAPGPTTTSRRCSSSAGSTRPWKSSTDGRPTRATRATRSPRARPALSGPDRSRPRRRSTRRWRCWRRRSSATASSAIRTGKLVRSSRWAWSAVAPGRSAPPATRSPRRSKAFEQLGAATWIERARSELGSIGGRTREEGLTPAEQRVAALVAEGRTNREVAAALFLGERTVASHLTHIYAKLGIRSRTELARALPE